MKKAKVLTREYVRSSLLYVSDGSMIRTSNRTRPDLIGKKVGTVRPDGYVKVRLNGSFYYLHRLVWIFHFCIIPEGYMVDHINRNPSDNRIENLRLVLDFENMQNMRTRKKTKTGLMGITIKNNAKKMKYLVQIKCKGLRIAKTFSNINDANEFYLSKKREIHEFNTL